MKYIFQVHLSEVSMFNIAWKLYTKNRSTLDIRKGSPRRLWIARAENETQIPETDFFLFQWNIFQLYFGENTTKNVEIGRGFELSLAAQVSRFPTHSSFHFL